MNAAAGLSSRDNRKPELRFDPRNRGEDLGSSQRSPSHSSRRGRTRTEMLRERQESLFSGGPIAGGNVVSDPYLKLEQRTVRLQRSLKGTETTNRRPKGVMPPMTLPGASSTTSQQPSASRKERHKGHYETAPPVGQAGWFVDGHPLWR